MPGLTTQYRDRYYRRPETKSPVIVQVNRGALVRPGQVLNNIINAAVELLGIPVAIHLTTKQHDAIKRAIDLGFTSVMIDGSLLEDGKTPSDFEYNVKITSEVVKYAHDRGVSVEGELGTLGGIEDGVGSGKTQLTDPDQAVEFVERTGVDALAISIGTSHGAYKFKGEPKIAFAIIEKTRQLLPDTYLVSHGSSSVPEEHLALINQYGGRMEAAKGVPLEALKKAIQYGINKINVDTDIRLAATGAVRKFLAENPEAFDPRAYLKASRAAIADEIKKRMEAFGTAGQAAAVPQWGLEEMKTSYKRN